MQRPCAATTKHLVRQTYYAMIGVLADDIVSGIVVYLDLLLALKLLRANRNLYRQVREVLSPLVLPTGQRRLYVCQTFLAAGKRTFIYVNDRAITVDLADDSVRGWAFSAENEVLLVCASSLRKFSLPTGSEVSRTPFAVPADFWPRHHMVAVKNAFVGIGNSGEVFTGNTERVEPLAPLKVKTWDQLAFDGRNGCYSEHKFNTFASFTFTGRVVHVCVNSDEENNLTVGETPIICSNVEVLKDWFYRVSDTVLPQFYTMEQLITPYFVEQTEHCHYFLVPCREAVKCGLAICTFDQKSASGSWSIR